MARDTTLILNKAFTADAAIHVSNARKLEEHSEAPKDYIPLINKDALPETSEHPRPALLVMNEELYLNTTAGWQKLAFVP